MTVKGIPKMLEYIEVVTSPQLSFIPRIICSGPQERPSEDNEPEKEKEHQ